MKRSSGSSLAPGSWSEKSGSGAVVVVVVVD